MKRFMIVLIFALAATTLAIAGGQGEAATTEGPTDIIYYMWDDPTYMQIVEAFGAANDSVVVNVNEVPAADYEVKLLTVLAGGVEMDAYMQKRQTDMFAQYANGYIEPLDDLIAEANYDIEGLSAYDSAIRLDGQYVAIPFRGASWYTYFNKVMFDEAGEPYPTEYVENGEWTWDKFQEVANRLATGDGEEYGGLFYTWGPCHVVPALQDGVKFITQEGEIDLNETVPYSFRLRYELEDTLAIIPLVELKVTKTHYSTAFFGGNVAMLIIGEWFPGQLMNARDEGMFEGFTWNDWGVTRLPWNTEEYTTFGNPTFNHVHADSDKKSAAFEFIGWMGGTDGAVETARAGFLPARINDGVKEALKEAIPDDTSFGYFTEGPTVMPQFYTKYGSRIDQAIGELMESYLVEGPFSDSELMAAFEERFTEIIQTTD
jgi:multiple sugar transport system substrate-binding protein